VSDGIFDAGVAATYDADCAAMFADDVVGPTVDLLAELAAGGPALELAIGTGRIALPLRERGVEVAGIDISQAMIGRLRAKPGGDGVPVAVGDMATTGAPGRFRLVYLVFNSITNLLTQDRQVACFRNAAAHLEAGGRFVVEVFVPPLRRLPVGERFLVADVSDRHIGIDELDVAEQLLTSHHWWADTGGGRRRFESTHRYAWPTELDLMARLAGMTLRHRWGGWRREPFTGESTTHVSVWETRRDRPATPC
jgi:SAM-dependent methyltransferase